MTTDTTTINGDIVWQAKLAAWTHDPAEKALVLLRDPGGHEGGTVRALQAALFGDAGASHEIRAIVGTADRWAAAADRPQFPQPRDEHARWARVNFADHPVLIHPLSARPYHLATLGDVDFREVRAVSLDHFQKLIVRAGNEIDARKTFLSFWRNGPTSPHGSLGVLWDVLPADTRVPDHSIWDHLNLTSALAGAMAADPDRNVALLAVSLGPVQSFIEQGRSTLDLWAGSHLLSRLAWEALKVVCERCGPDSVIFPHLHGVPLVDLWLRQQGITVTAPELDTPTDANPAFVASLPNRFVAIVPESSAASLAESIVGSLRTWVSEQAGRMIDALVQAADLTHDDARHHLEQQADRQLRHFPEIHWAIVPWHLAVLETNSDGVSEPIALRRAIESLVDTAPEGALLGTPAWQVLSKEVHLGSAVFYSPNPGVLYPDLYLLLDRLLAAARATRTFEPTCEHGYRCSVCGEREWLSSDRAALLKDRAGRGDTLWSRVARKNPRWARKSEHLCAVCALKRLWSFLFAKELSPRLNRTTPGDGLQQFVVSTHTMALAPTLDRALGRLSGGAAGEQTRSARQAFQALRDDIDRLGVDDFVALPKRLADELTRRGGDDNEIARVIRRIPALLDRVSEDADEDDRRVQEVRTRIKALTGAEPERYYALILLDGDRMGAWLSGTEHSDADGDGGPAVTIADCWHGVVRDGVARLAEIEDSLRSYLGSPRPPSPSRHIFISRALNAFSIHLARLIVEERHNGKLLYAGGDDVLAMVGIDDLLHVLFALRCAYSGVAPGDGVTLDDQAGSGRSRPDIRLGRDHVLLQEGTNRRLYRMMGHRATLSAGAVIAHYSAPLSSVLRELRRAERRAKSRDGGGRDAFSITLMKRAGGIAHFTSKWFPIATNDPTGTADGGDRSAPDAGMPPSSIGVLLALRDALAGPLGRRAVYHLTEWLETVHPAITEEQMAALLAYQFSRQRAENDTAGAFDPESLGRRLAALAMAQVRRGDGTTTSSRLTAPAAARDALVVAEFLARAGRVGATEGR